MGVCRIHGDDSGDLFLSRVTRQADSTETISQKIFDARPGREPILMLDLGMCLEILARAVGDDLNIGDRLTTYRAAPLDLRFPCGLTEWLGRGFRDIMQSYGDLFGAVIAPI